MKREQVELLIESHNFPFNCGNPELIETHISWVILCDKMVFKIKKPVNYSFLDFSTIEKREFYCRQEVLLNRRLVENIYLGVVPIVLHEQTLQVAMEEKGEIIDYAVMMKRMPSDRRMDLMLAKDKVTLEHIEQIAQRLVLFHEHAPIVYNPDHLSVQHNFNDLTHEKEYLLEHIDIKYVQMITNAIERSDSFVKAHVGTLKTRSELGFIRDCHGDLHSRNIFLLEKPIIFDCIEFNEQIRQIDILSELAFFCMDLEALGHPELSEYFMICYTKLTDTIHTEQERELFIYYKAYRANVRAKVNALRMKGASGHDFEKALGGCIKYLELMNEYLESLSEPFVSDPKNP